MSLAFGVGTQLPNHGARGYSQKVVVLCRMACVKGRNMHNALIVSHAKAYDSSSHKTKPVAQGRAGKSADGSGRALVSSPSNRRRQGAHRRGMAVEAFAFALSS